LFYSNGHDTLEENKRKEAIMAKNSDIGIFQLANGNWAYRITLYKDGKKKDTTCRRKEDGTPFKTKREAKLARESRLVEIRKGEDKIVNVPKRYVKDVWQEYLDKDSKGKATATVRKYSSLWKNHVEAEFADKLITEITIADLQNFLQKLYSSGLSYKYVESFLKMFYLLFGIAYNKEWIDTEKYTRMFINKGTKLTMPAMSQEDKEKEDDIETYESYEIHQMEQIFKNGNCYTAFLLGYYLGVRISECFGLMWSDYNWDNHIMTINKQMVYEDGCFCLKPVKTLTSVRQIDVPEILHKHLLEKIRMQKKHPSKSYLSRKSEIVLDRTTDTEKIITGGDFINRKDNGELLTINSMKYWAKQIKAETGINFKYHSLRKTHISQLAAMNTPAVEVMQRVGHKKYETTMKYYINTNAQTKKILYNNLEMLNTEELQIEMTNPDGTKKIVSESTYVKMKKLSSIIPH